MRRSFRIIIFLSAVVLLLLFSFFFRNSSVLDKILPHKDTFEEKEEHFTSNIPDTDSNDGLTDETLEIKEQPDYKAIYLN